MTIKHVNTNYVYIYYRIKSRVKSDHANMGHLNVACSSTSNIAKCPKFIEELNFLIRLSIAYICKYQHI